MIVYHFMFGPDWKEGCPSCSFLADSFNGAPIHLAQRDATMVVVSRATLPQIEAFKKRMGWGFKWLSSFGSDFNSDYQVSSTKEEQGKGKVYYNYTLKDSPSEERPGLSVFYKNEDGHIFHTYSTYERGLDILVAAYQLLDMTAKGRDEGGLSYPMAWVRHHDRYGDGTVASCCAGEEVKKATALDSMLGEFREEAATTRRVLDRIPSDKLGWKPHPKSMTLGQLANHIAIVPGRLAKITQAESFDASQASFEPPQPKSVAEISSTFEQSVREVEDHLKGMTEERAQGSWRLMLKDKEIFRKPRVDVMRSIMLNHWYHHRGQLSVYLRMLDVPVPVIYGRSADENPFT